jgi:hypothetical protein
MVARNLLAASCILVLAGCGATSTQCVSGRTIWYEDANGVAKSRAETYTCPAVRGDVGPASNSSGIFSEGEMAAPPPGQAWWD